MYSTQLRIFQDSYFFHASNDYFQEFIRILKRKYVPFACVLDFRLYFAPWSEQKISHMQTIIYTVYETSKK